MPSDEESASKRPGVRAIGFVLSLVLVFGVGAFIYVSSAAAKPVLSGDAGRGRDIMPRYGCPTCHTIPGVRGAHATVGPPLDAVARRVYVGGRVNTHANLVAFLKDPNAERVSAMPNVGLDDRDATDVAAYLATLR